MPTEAREQDLYDLYSQYRRLALAVSAALLLDEDPIELAPQVQSLLAAAKSAADRAVGEERQLAGSCVHAASTLRDLVDTGTLRVASGTSRQGARQRSEVRAVRDAHSRLRRQMWRWFPCDYVPCGHQTE